MPENANPLGKPPDRTLLLDYFDSVAPMRDSWIKTNWYYHDQLARTLSFFIPAGSSVIEIGSGTGVLLDLLKPTRGLGIDISPAMVDIARRNYSYLEFRTDELESLEKTMYFDSVLLSDIFSVY